jgi:hypothetical protein
MKIDEGGFVKEMHSMALSTDGDSQLTSPQAPKRYCIGKAIYAATEEGYDLWLRDSTFDPSLLCVA